MEVGLRVPLEAEVATEGVAVLPGPPAARRRPGAAGGEGLARAARLPSRTLSSCSGGATFHIRTLRAEDFPPFPEAADASAVEVPAQGVRRDGQPRRALRLAGRDAPDPHRHPRVGVRERAADGRHRLLPAEREGDARSSRRSRVSFEANVPARALQELARVAQGSDAETLRVAVRENQVVFGIDGVVLSSRLIDGQFPNYRQLLPEAYEHELRVVAPGADRRRAPHQPARAEERAAAARRSGRARLTISAQTPDVGEASRDAAAPVRGRAVRDRLQPGVPARRPGERRGRRPPAQADQPASPRASSRPATRAASVYLIMPIRLNVWGAVR